MPAEVPVQPELKQQMLDYIRRDVVRRPGIHVGEDTPLVSSGLVDSFALIEILLRLEKITSRRIPVAKVQPKDLDSVTLMFATAERVGKAK